MAVRAGDAQAFKLLVLWISHVILNPRWRLDCEPEDISQETTLAVYQWLKENTLETATLWTFACGIAHHKCTDRHRICTSRHFVDIDEIDPPGTDPNPEEQLIIKEEKERVALEVEVALSRIRPRSSNILRLRDIEKKSYEEIAGILDIPLGTVKSQVHRARLEARAEIECHRREQNHRKARATI
jgi:RNA polymerase sigma-70 factor (ECF subfamily)